MNVVGTPASLDLPLVCLLYLLRTGAELLDSCHIPFFFLFFAPVREVRVAKLEQVSEPRRCDGLRSERLAIETENRKTRRMLQRVL